MLGHNLTLAIGELLNAKMNSIMMMGMIMMVVMLMIMSLVIIPENITLTIAECTNTNMILRPNDDNSAVQGSLTGLHNRIANSKPA